MPWIRNTTLGQGLNQMFQELHTRNINVPLIYICRVVDCEFDNGNHIVRPFQGAPNGPWQKSRVADPVHFQQIQDPVPDPIGTYQESIQILNFFLHQTYSF